MALKLWQAIVAKTKERSQLLAILDTFIGAAGGAGIICNTLLDHSALLEPTVNGMHALYRLAAADAGAARALIAAGAPRAILAAFARFTSSSASRLAADAPAEARDLLRKEHLKVINEASVALNALIRVDAAAVAVQLAEPETAKVIVSLVGPASNWRLPQPTKSGFYAASSLWAALGDGSAGSSSPATEQTRPGATEKPPSGTEAADVVGSAAAGSSETGFKPWLSEKQKDLLSGLIAAGLYRTLAARFASVTRDVDSRPLDGQLAGVVGHLASRGLNGLPQVEALRAAGVLDGVCNALAVWGMRCPEDGRYVVGALTWSIRLMLPATGTLPGPMMSLPVPLVAYLQTWRPHSRGTEPEYLSGPLRLLLTLLRQARIDVQRTAAQLVSRTRGQAYEPLAAPKRDKAAATSGKTEPASESAAPKAASPTVASGTAESSSGTAAPEAASPAVASAPVTDADSDSVAHAVAVTDSDRDNDSDADAKVAAVASPSTAAPAAAVAAPAPATATAAAAAPAAASVEAPLLFSKSSLLMAEASKSARILITSIMWAAGEVDEAWRKEQPSLFKAVRSDGDGAPVRGRMALHGPAPGSGAGAAAETDRGRGRGYDHGYVRAEDYEHGYGYDRSPRRGTPQKQTQNQTQKPDESRRNARHGDKTAGAEAAGVAAAAPRRPGDEAAHAVRATGTGKRDGATATASESANASASVSATATAAGPGAGSGTGTGSGFVAGTGSIPGRGSAASSDSGAGAGADKKPEFSSGSNFGFPAKPGSRPPRPADSFVHSGMRGGRTFYAPEDAALAFDSGSAYGGARRQAFRGPGPRSEADSGDRPPRRTYGGGAASASAPEARPARGSARSNDGEEKRGSQKAASTGPAAVVASTSASASVQPPAPTSAAEPATDHHDAAPKTVPVAHAPSEAATVTEPASAVASWAHSEERSSDAKSDAAPSQPEPVVAATETR